MMKKTKSWGVLLFLTFLFIAGRLDAYGILRDSVAANDTSSYFDCAKADFTKIEAYECHRSATLPFIIQKLNPDLKYELTDVSEPFFGSEAELQVQPGTEKLVIFQTLLSIFSWCFFTLTVVGLFRHELSKIFAAIILFGFAFVPQIADWDSVLLSESMSFSFFILLCAFLIRFLQNCYGPGSLMRRFLSGFFLLISAIFWLFTRDTNAYFIAFLSVIFFILFWATIFSHRKFQGLMLVLSLCLAACFLFQQQTFRTSKRWLLPLLNNLTTNVFPYPERVAFFEEKGMPVNEAVLSQSGSAEYNDLYNQKEFIQWAETNGLSAYTAFLMNMPLWSVQQIFLNLDGFFAENLQPFFYGKPDEKPHWADKVGNVLHPLSSAVLWIDLFLLLILFIYTIRKRDADSLVWFLFSFLLTIGSIMMISVAYLGEVRSVWRHVLCGVMPLRLILWIQILEILDQSLDSRPSPPIINRLGGQSNRSETDKILDR